MLVGLIAFFAAATTGAAAASGAAATAASTVTTCERNMLATECATTETSRAQR